MYFFLEYIVNILYLNLEQREKKLIEWVHYAMDHHPDLMDAVANVLYLFYDEYDTGKPDWHILIPS
jgi:hypothetical protein